MERKNVKVLKRVVLFCFILFIISLGFVACSNYYAQKMRLEIDFKNIELIQLENPQEGDVTATIKTTLGDVKAVLYPQYSPKAVQNFIDLAQSGYYDDTYVFHAEDGAYSAMGAPLKDGSLLDGYDEEKELIEMELNQNLWPLKGAVCVLPTAVKRSFKDFLKGDAEYFVGSRFALLNTIEFTDEIKQELYDFSSETRLPDAFIENGGIPNFSQQMTVIGQVYEGLDIVEQLSNLETTESLSSSTQIPVKDIRIITVEIGKYSENNSSAE